MEKRGQIWFFSLFFLVVSMQIISASNYYVDKSAIGVNSGTSWANAWVNISSINWSVIGFGDTLYIQGGNYGEHFDITNKNNITVKIAPGATQKAIFLGGQSYNVDNSLIDGWNGSTQMFVFTALSSLGNNGYTIRESNTTIFRGLEVGRENDSWESDSGQNHGIAINGNVDVFNLTIDHCYIHHHSGDGISIIATSPVDNRYDNFIISNNTIIHVGDDGIQAGSNTDITVENNYIDNDNAPALFGGHPDGFQLNPQGGNVIIRNNIFRGFNQNIFIEYANKSIYLYNNILIGIRTNGTDRGMTLSVANWSNNTKFVVANNIFYNFVSYLGIAGSISPVPAANRTFANNIFLDTKLLVQSDDEALVGADNIYWNEPGVQYYDSSGNAISTPSNQSNGNANYIDPLFLNATNYSFTLLTGSPAIDSGLNLSILFSTDKNGTIRPQGSAWDSGAYEYLFNGPVTRLNLPTNNVNKSNSAIVFNCSANDGTSLTNLTLYGNWSGIWSANETVSLSGLTNSTNYTKNLPDGNYIWNCLAYDNNSVSGWASSNYTINIDTTAPVISIIYPSNSSVANSSSLNLTYSIGDSNSISNCSVFANGVSVSNISSVTKNVNTNVSLVLASQIYNITLNCTDNFNNVGTSSIYNVNVSFNDTTSPSISIISPSNGSTQAVNYVFINTTNTDESNYSSFIDWNRSLMLWYSFNDKNSTGDPTDLSSYSLNGTKVGNVTYNSSGIRGGAFRFNDSESVLVIPQNQSLNLTTKTISFWAYLNSLKVNAVFEDSTTNDYISITGAGAMTVRWTNGSGTSKSADFAVSASTGRWDLYSLIYNVSGQNVNITVYKNAQIISSSNYTDGLTGSPIRTIGNRVFPSGVFFDGFLDEFMIFNRTLSTQEILALYNSQSNSLYNNFTNLNNGTYNFKVGAIDINGNHNYSLQQTVIINTSADVIAPQVTIVSPTNTTYSSIVNFNLSSNENLSSCVLSFNNFATNYSMTLNSSLTGANYTNLSMIDGSFTVKFACNDTSSAPNNFNSSQYVLFSVDTTAPIIALPVYSNATQKKNIDSLTLNVSVIDSGVGGSYCAININGTNQTFSVSSGWCNTTFGNLTGLSDGDQYILVYANDSLGNLALNNSYVVSIDTTAPQVTINSPTNTTYSSNATQLVNFTLNEAGYCQYSLDNGTTNHTMINTSGTIFTNVTSSLSNGNYYLIAFCNDSLGNKNYSQSVNFTVSISSSNSSSSSSSGGGGATTNDFWYGTTNLADTQLSDGYTHSFSNRTRVLVNVKGENHTVGVIDFNQSKKIATINVSSNIQIKTLSVGDLWKVDVNDDEIYDLVLKLNNVLYSGVNITISKSSETYQIQNLSNSTVGNNSSNQDNQTGKYFNWNIFWLVFFIVVILVIAVGLIISILKYKEKSLNKKIRYLNKK